MKKTCYVTTPIYYASGNVHIGNSYTTVACDTFARYYRLKGYDTYFLTGMDEHGQKIEEAAKKAGVNPQDYVNGIAKSTKKIWESLEITNDDFIQTSEIRHTEVVQRIFEQMLANGDIYLGSYEGDYCVSCEAFFTKTQIGEENVCPDCGKPLRKVKEESYFLNLKKYSQQLLDYIALHPDFIQPESRKNEVVSFIESGLDDLCVSRTSFKWGIPVLSNPKHVVYVWIDALCNYITALGYDSKDQNKYQKFWLNGDVVRHVVGKDILRFHAIYWPIMLMAINVPITFKIYVHGWYLFKDGKMSKSKGNVIYPNDITERYGVDPLRLYLVKELSLGNDGLFTYERFFEKYNSYLANDLGNLVKRTISMINKYFNGEVKKPAKTYHPSDKELSEYAEKVVEIYHESFSEFRFQNGLNEVWNLISRGNKYIDETTPWVLAKDESKLDQLNSVMYHLYELLRLVAIMILPVMPTTATTILDEIGASSEERSFASLVFGNTLKANVVSEPTTLFKRLDIDSELKFQEDKKVKLVTKDLVSIDDFEKLDLRVGKVLSAKRVEGSDKLLVLDVKIEEEVRQIVSGIAKSYQPNDLVGKNIVVVANLKPVKLKGVLSSGMILTAESKNEELEVLEVNVDEFSKVR